MNLRIDPNEFAPIIEQAVDAAIARILGDRVENAKVPILSRNWLPAVGEATSR